MNAQTLPGGASHPSPERHKASLAALIYGLATAPLAWSLQSVTGYALATRACYPTDSPRATPQVAHLGSWLLALNLAALVLAATAVVVAWRSWQATRREHYGSTSQLLEIGEGRTRFLAMCGMLVSAGFVIATLFTTAALVLSPLCR